LADPRVSSDEIAAICEALLGNAPTDISYPGGMDRKTVVATVAGRGVVVTKRSSVSRADLEAAVLQALGGSDGVPALLGQRGQFVVQSQLVGRRLSEALEVADTRDRTGLLVAAGRALIALQARANANGLRDMAPKIGDREGWRQDFARSPDRLADLIGEVPPTYDLVALAETIAAGRPSFVKWDARPGNALVDAKGAVGWFDWEHCGVGSGEDDLVWLLADEWAPNVPKAEFELLKTLAEAHGVAFKPLVKRFHTKAVLHSMIRLGLIFRRKGDGPWWSAKSALENDRVGVSLAHVRRVVTRADRWASAHEDMHDLRGLLQQAQSYAEAQ